MAANPLSCDGSKEVSCFSINPRGETTVDKVFLHHEQIGVTPGWDVFSGSGIFAVYLLEEPTTGDYQVEPYSSSDIVEGIFASVPVSLKGAHVSLRDPAHSSLDHYLASSGTIHIKVDGSLLLADWDDVEVHSAERVSNFTGGRSRGHIVFHAESQTVSMGAAGGSN